MSSLNRQIILLFFLLILANCGTQNKSAYINPDTGKHSINWYTEHRIAAKSSMNDCKGCHGLDLKGGSVFVSCYTDTFGG